jgi:hypothetical protein
MVWGCFVKNKLGSLVIVEGRITGQVYQQLLQNYLIPFLDNVGAESTFVF